MTTERPAGSRLKTYGDRAYAHTTVVRHQGTTVALAMDDMRRLYYSVLDLDSIPDGGQAQTQAEKPRELDAYHWAEEPRPLAFPAELARSGHAAVGALSVPRVDQGSGHEEKPEEQLRDEELNAFLSTTARLSADAPFAAVSDGKHLFVFRQAVTSGHQDALFVRDDGGVSGDATRDDLLLDGAGRPVQLAVDALLCDRFVLAGSVLKPVQEVRYRRSRHRDRPESAKDSLGITDMDGRPFHEPTQVLRFVGPVTAGRFAVVLVPTAIAGTRRWQFFVHRAASDRVDAVSVEQGEDGLFHTQGTRFFTSPDPAYQDAVLERGPGICPFTKLPLVPVRPDTRFAESALALTGGAHAEAAKGAEVLGLGTGAYTVEAWLKPSATPGTILSTRDTSDAGISLSVAEGGALVLVHGTAVAAATPDGDGAAPAEESAGDDGSGEPTAGAEPEAGGTEAEEADEPTAEPAAEPTAPAITTTLTSEQGAVPTGRFSHVAAVFDGTMATLYVDGSVVAAAELPPAAGAGTRLLVGATSAADKSAGEFFTGELDEVRIWLRARRAERLARDAGVRLVGDEPDLAAYYRFDEGTGSLAYDQCGALHLAVSEGAAWVASLAPVADQPGIRRDAFRVTDRRVASGLSAALYHQQEEAPTGHSKEAKPLKRQARILLAWTTTAQDEATGRVTSLDLAVDRNGRVAQLPDVLELPLVGGSVTEADPEREKQLTADVARLEKGLAAAERRLDSITEDLKKPEQVVKPLLGALATARDRADLPTQNGSSKPCHVYLSSERGDPWSAGLGMYGFRGVESGSLQDGLTLDSVVESESLQGGVGFDSDPRLSDVFRHLTVQHDASGTDRVVGVKGAPGPDDAAAQWRLVCVTVGGEPETDTQSVNGWQVRHVPTGKLLGRVNGEEVLLKEAASDAVLYYRNGSLVSMENLVAATLSERQATWGYMDHWNPAESLEVSTAVSWNVYPVPLHPSNAPARTAAKSIVRLLPRAAALEAASKTKDFVQTRTRQAQGLREKLEAEREELGRITAGTKGRSDRVLPMVHLGQDRCGLGWSGAVLDFAQTTDAPMVADSGSGHLGLYFRDGQGQMTGLFYDTNIGRSGKVLSAGDDTALHLTAREAGVSLADASVEVAADSTGLFPGRCTLTLTTGKGEKETWRLLPRRATAAADALNGLRAAPVPVGTAVSSAGGVLKLSGKGARRALAVGDLLEAGGVVYALTAVASAGATELRVVGASTGTGAVAEGSGPAAPGEFLLPVVAPEVAEAAEAVAEPEGATEATGSGDGEQTTSGAGRTTPDTSAGSADAGDTSARNPAGGRPKAGVEVRLISYDPSLVTHSRPGSSAAFGSRLVAAALIGTSGSLTDGTARDEGLARPPRWWGDLPGRALAFGKETRPPALPAKLLPSIGADADLTLEAWVHPESGGPARVVHASLPDGGYTLALGDRIASGRPLTAAVGSRSVTSRIPVPDGRWSHVAAAFEQSWALRLSGNSYAEAAHADDLNIGRDLTLEVFFRADTLTSPQGLLSKGHLADGGGQRVPYQLSVDRAGHLVFGFEGTGGAQVSLTSTGTVTPGTFHRVAVVRALGQSRTETKGKKDIEVVGPDGKKTQLSVDIIEAVQIIQWSDITFYIDGEEAGTTRYTDAPDLSHTGPLVIGRAPRGVYHRGLTGVISEVRVWNTARQPADIGVTLPPPRPQSALTAPAGEAGADGADRPKGLIARWRLEENEGTTAADDAGRHTARLHSTAWIKNPDPLGSTFRLYLDGQPIAGSPPASGDALSEGTYGEKQFTLGGRLDGDKVAEPFTGTLEEVRVWRTARSQEQVLDNLFGRLTGERQDLLAYYPFDDESTEAEATVLADHGPHALDLDLPAPGPGRPEPVASTAPISSDIPEVRPAFATGRPAFVQQSAAAPAVCEYADLQRLADGSTRGVLKRCYVYVQDGVWNLVTGYKVGDLVSEWVGQVQFDPQLVGYIEGAPPVPSENLVATRRLTSLSYVNSASVEFTQADQVVQALSSSTDTSVDSTLATRLGTAADAETLMITAPLGFGVAKPIVQGGIDAYGGLTLDFSNAWGHRTELSESTETTRSTSIGLSGGWEPDDEKKQIDSDGGRRFQPVNTGYALVQSETADVYALRLAHSGSVVAYRMLPNPDIPRDWNLLPFPINPRYTKQGTLDGSVGYNSTGKITDPDYRDADGYGEYSYYKPTEAYALKRRITQDIQRRQAYYEGVSTETHTSDPTSERARALLSSFMGPLQNIDTHQRATKADAEAFARRDIVNTYAWSADGGFFAETTQSTDIVTETTTGSYRFNGMASLGMTTGVRVFGIGASLQLDAALGGGISRTRARSKEATRSFSLDVRVDTPGDMQKYDDQSNPVFKDGKPVEVPGRVDAYRFMTFYLDSATANFDDFYGKVIDQQWLDSPDANAAALRQARQSDHRPPCWRILHRVTFVSRKLPPTLPEGATPLETTLHSADISSNYELIRRLEPYVDPAVQDRSELTRQIRDTLARELPELTPHTATITDFYADYLGIA
ncbi:LamG-like jellyroll fold domain-containing protein [Streptomyces pinistramenti]|uniref:LamG-like jellyroll fold domain-containing protein n=1 Tax=Streptomyces pinistramenti TaxID=2884812 RepID=UPI001D065A51|nr:LamG-like jellyroll fold domain-containing protein [Streptomyces pinistramenti]MCB5908210.1 hypothetical protein [Streptomyces pinistramenti]